MIKQKNLQEGDIFVQEILLNLRLLRILHRLRLFILHWRQDQLHLTQIRYRVAQDERIVILQIQLNTRTETCALSKEHQMLQLENALNNFTGARRLLHLHCAIILRNHCLLFSKVADTLEGEVRTRGRNLDIEFLTKRIHVAANLLDVR